MIALVDTGLLSLMEMLYESLLVMTAPFLVQVYSAGGPPLVLPYRVKVGKVAINDDN